MDSQEKTLIVLLAALGLITAVSILIGYNLSWHYDALMAEKGFCYQRYDVTNSSPVWQWGKCK